MPGWKKVLCPIDFSETSRHGMMEALEIGRRHGARVRLLHVLEEPWATSQVALLAPPEAVGRYRESVLTDLAAWKKIADDIAPGCAVSELLTGHPATEIVRVARENGMDLIVMGTHGRRGIRRLLMGSVADEVVRSAPCSVLVVRPFPETVERD
jgi:universal stress protein A